VRRFSRHGRSGPPNEPLDLILCSECGLLQLAHNFQLQGLFHDSYGYRSGLNESMSAHLQELAGSALRYVDLQPGDFVLDIGANDGTLLRHFESTKNGHSVNLIAVDPLLNQFEAFYEDGSVLLLADFFSAETAGRALGNERCKVVSSIAMFYDLPEPNEFVADIQRILHEDGVWVLELSYMPSMLASNSVDTICHEHLEYYALAPLERLLSRHRLSIVDVSLNSVNGGSFRVIVTHGARAARVGGLSRNPRLLDRLRADENRANLKSVAPYHFFFERSRRVRDDIMDFFGRSRAADERVLGYGASTKGNTLLQFCGLSAAELPAIADRNPMKTGRRTPRTNIPIVSEAEARSRDPDAFFCLPWHFRDSFVEREAAFIADGGRLVFPLPEFEIFGEGGS
jgi:NDP-4-keto-2,6-dideoxyhexose 3-C-methyltransferase